MRLQVVEQNGQWYCEYDGKTYPSMVRRYVTTLRCTDNTAELTLNAFNEQVGLGTQSQANEKCVLHICPSRLPLPDLVCAFQTCA